jgi:AcrR family transcriptional regulator
MAAEDLIVNRENRATCETSAHDGARQNKDPAHVSGPPSAPETPLKGPGVRRLPRQERSVATVDAILEAAAELFCGVGYDRASTNKIAVRAGVSIGSLYQYFANKEAILAALLDDHQRAVHRVVDAAMTVVADPAVPIADGLTTLMRRLVDLHAGDPELNRVLTEEVPHLAHGPSDRDEIERYAERVESILRNRPDVVVEDVATAALLLVTTVEALTRFLAHGAGPDTDTDACIVESTTMLAGYLTRPMRP